MTAKEIFIVMTVLAVTIATPTSPTDTGSSPVYSSSSTQAPHEQQLQKTDYISADPYPTQSTPRKVEDNEGWISSLRVAGRLLLDCSKSGDVVGCLKLKAVTSLGRALTTTEPIPLPLPFIDGVSLARDPQAVVPLTAEALEQSDAEVEASLPRSLDERGVRLDRLLIDRLEAFLRTRTVQVTVPLSMGLVEGRGKKDKKGGYAMIMVAAMAGMWMQMTMGGMAMMAGKALIVAKIALALAAVCLLKKMGGGGGDGHPQVGAAARMPQQRPGAAAPAAADAIAFDDDAAGPHQALMGAVNESLLAVETSSRAFQEEARRKGIGGKKGNGYLIILIAGLKAMMMQSAMGGIAMLSGKALLVAKIALLLALLCCLKKGGEEKSHQVIYAAPAEQHSSGGGGGGGGWQSSGGGGDWSKRSVTADPYSAYNPQTNRY